MTDGEGTDRGERPGEARLRRAIRRARQRIGPQGAANSCVGTPGAPGSSANSCLGGLGELGGPVVTAPPRRVTLLRILTTRCSAEDLRTLCFVLGVNHEVLPGTGKAAHARELVAYFDRRQDLDALVAVLLSLRPDVGEELGALSGQVERE